MSDFDEELLEIYETEEQSDYFIKLHRGGVVPIDSPYYNEGRVEIEIFGRNFNEEYTYMVNINGQQYKINQIKFDKIKSFIYENLRTFID